MRQDSDEAFKGLQHLFGELKGRLHFLETNIPVEMQMEYFRYSDRVRNEPRPTSIEEQIDILQSPESSPEELKYAVTYLAVSGDVKAYRIIESYSQEHPECWVMMALVQAKIVLETELSDEKQIFISTGLGGKGDKLRFAGLFKANRLRAFSQYQRELIEKEVSYAIERQDGEVEEITIAENYFTILFLVHITVDVKDMLENIINECNQYGNFIDNSFIITNIKPFSEEEIRRELHGKR